MTLRALAKSKQTKTIMWLYCFRNVLVGCFQLWILKSIMCIIINGSRYSGLILLPSCAFRRWSRVWWRRGWTTWAPPRGRPSSCPKTAPSSTPWSRPWHATSRTSGKWPSRQTPGSYDSQLIMRYRSTLVSYLMPSWWKQDDHAVCRNVFGSTTFTENEWKLYYLWSQTLFIGNVWCMYSTIHIWQHL